MTLISSRFDCPSGGNFAVDEHCQHECQWLHTPYNIVPNGHLRYLDRHDVNCPAGQALTSIYVEPRVNADNTVDIRYKYMCCAIYKARVVSSVTQRLTDKTTYQAASSLIYLEQQDIRCAADAAVMKRFRMRSSETEIWYMIDCFELATDEYSGRRVQRQSQEFRTHLKWASQIFGGGGITCNNGGTQRGPHMGVVAQWKIVHSGENSQFIYTCVNII